LKLQREPAQELPRWQNCAEALVKDGETPPFSTLSAFRSYESEFPVKDPFDLAASSAAVLKQPLLGQPSTSLVGDRVLSPRHHLEDRASLKVTAMLQKVRKVCVDGRIKPIIIEIPPTRMLRGERGARSAQFPPISGVPDDGDAPCVPS